MLYTKEMFISETKKANFIKFCNVFTKENSSWITCLKVSTKPKKDNN